MEDNNSSTQSATTTINSNDITAIAKFHVPTDIPTSLLSIASTGTEQDIKTFLAKPVLILSGSFDSSTVATGIFDSLQLPEDLFSKEVYKRKLQGYLGVRGKIILRLQINATKFQQGRIILGYNPVALDAFRRYQSPTTITQLPHVQMDIATQTEVILEIPYTQIYTHFGLLSGEGRWGDAFLYNYLPFRTGAGSTNCDYSVWASMEDVELVTPTANKGYIAQMAGDRFKKSPSRETELLSQGPVSSALSKISDAATMLAQVPLLSSIAHPVAWITQIGSQVASIFGWSNPINELPIERRNITTYQYENNCDKIDNAFSLGLTTTNKVSILPGLGGTDLDEMSMSFLNSVNFFYYRYAWTTSNVVGDAIMTIDLRPSDFFRTNDDGAIAFGPISYFATLFNYYRGSLKFKFKFAKTIFHSGRLVLAYCPGYNGSGTPFTVNLDESAYTYREILDMRDACEFEFTMPYASVRPYLKSDQQYGRFTLLVLNPLVAPDTVDTTVDIALEVSGTPDFEWFDPVSPKYLPVAQSASDRVGATRPNVDQTIGNSVLNRATNISSELCVGERILSVKQLLARNCAWGSTANVTLNSIGFRPFDIYNSVVNRPFSLVYAARDSDYFDIFSSFYRFSRGGVNTRFQMRATYPETEGKWLVPKNNSDSTTMSVTAPSLATCQSHVYENTANGNTVSVLVPMYHPTHARVNFGSTQSSAILPYTRHKEPYTSSQYVSITNTAGGSSTGTIYRSVADDFQLGFFVGIPPMLSRTALGF